MKYRRVGVLAVRLHQIGPGEELVGGIHAAEVLALDIHKPRQTCARADKDRLETLRIHQLVDGQHPADDHVGFYFNAESLDGLDLLLHDSLGQTELGNAVYEHAARKVQRLKNRDLIAQLGEVSRTGQAGGTRTDDRHLVAVRRGLFDHDILLRVVPIGDEALQAPDTDGIAVFASDAARLALGLLRTDSSADRRQRAGAGDDLVSLAEISLAHLPDKGGNIYMYGTARHAGLVLAVKAACRFLHCGLGAVAQRDLAEIISALLRGLGRHLRLFRRHVRHLSPPPCSADDSFFRRRDAQSRGTSRCASSPRQNRPRSR